MIEDILLYFFAEILLGIIFYWPGWLMLRILTLGHYPPNQAVQHNRGGVTFFAIVVLIVTVITIINNHPNFFYLLRFNKEVHDLTIERRSKPAAEILSFCPLKLDSVNADWFDYGKLDYLFFEHRYHVYFFFEL